MSLLTDAIEAAEARKTAAFGETDHATIELPEAFHRRAIFSGYDLDDNEMLEVSERAGYYMSRIAANSDLPLHTVCATTWIDGMLVGLMIAKLSESHGDPIP
jgi:hypothetical protein